MIRTDLIAPFATLLQRHAAERPEKLAFEDATGARVTYRDLLPLTGRLAGHLQDRGVGAGESVAILVPNGVDWVISCVGIVRAAGVAVPISHDAVEAEIRYRLEDAGCRAIIVSQTHLALIERLRADLPLLAQVIVAGESHANGLPTLLANPPRSLPRDSEDLQATAFLVYTSGTTGKAKGVMLSLHSMLWVTAACWASIARLGPEDVVLSPLPLFHSYALNLCVVSIIATGASEFLLERFSTQQVVARLQTGRYTLMPSVPTIFHYLLETARANGMTQVPGVRLFISAGAILPGALNREFEARFGIPLLDGYGITETSTMVTMNWPGAPRLMGSCGLPLPGLAVRIVDLNGHDVPSGAEGQLIVRGPNVMLGYHNKPTETAEALRGGWYHTGDLARTDPNGFITITGRLKELIIRGGQNIAPAEVEDAVLSHPDVLDCAVAGIPHEHLGEVPAAFVVIREGRQVVPEEIQGHCSRLLSAYKVPSLVCLVSSIPRTGSGKVMRFKLTESLQNDG
jgi:long-chain acyl-CoA synthetase